MRTGLSIWKEVALLFSNPPASVVALVLSHKQRSSFNYFCLCVCLFLVDLWLCLQNCWASCSFILANTFLYLWSSSCQPSYPTIFLTTCPTLFFVLLYSLSCYFTSVTTALPLLRPSCPSAYLFSTLLFLKSQQEKSVAVI